MKIMQYHSGAPAINVRSMKEQCSEEEWQTRVDLAACYRLTDLYGMSDLANTHISARIPGSEEILINPYGYFQSEITASSLVKISLQGDILSRADESLNINPAGYVVHSAVHSVRPDVMCVLHTHTVAGGAVSALECGLIPVNQSGMRFIGSIGYHNYEGPVVNLEERVRMQESLGHNDALILRNHGLITCGATMGEAFYSMRSLERACQMQISAMSCNSPLHLPSEDVIAHAAHQFKRTTRRAYGVLEWPALLRQLDKFNPGYRE
jgi:ribulose-5-phosphate 4-epimerase/fuculose-1-phosphate aldolase